jgi:hypothetical protein
MDFRESLYLGRLLYRYIFPGRRKVSDKSCRGNQDKHFKVNNFFPEGHALYELIAKKYKTQRSWTIKDNLTPSTVIEFDCDGVVGW